MKLSEKTLELNICAQVAKAVSPGKNLFWFGLTQKQEAKAGFDACAKLGGRLLVFQFKASNRVLKSGERVFLAPHDQMLALRARASARRRSVFYAFPLVGSTAELRRNPDLLSQTWLLDVAGLPVTISAPEKSPGVLRKNNCHNVYVRAGSVVIHSDPIEAPTTSIRGVAAEGFAGADGLNTEFNESFEKFWEFAQRFTSGARGMVLW